MREETWYKMLILSTILHLVFITAISIPYKKSTKRIDLSSSYSVNLVGDMAGGPPGQGKGIPAVGEEPKATPAPQKATQEKITQPPAVKKKQVPVRRDTKAVSLSKQKVPEKHNHTHSTETLTKDELSRFDRRISEIQKRTNYLDVSQMRPRASAGGGDKKAGNQGYGLPISGQGGSRPLDLISQKYIMDIWEKIKEAWGLPGLYSSKKNLESIVTIKIRKDGRIIEINFEKRSGDRLYDESILRAIRSIDPLPPVPPSFNSDTVELGFRFLPGDLS